MIVFGCTCVLAACSITYSMPLILRPAMPCVGTAAGLRDVGRLKLDLFSGVSGLPS